MREERVGSRDIKSHWSWKPLSEFRWKIFRDELKTDTDIYLTQTSEDKYILNDMLGRLGTPLFVYPWIKQHLCYHCKEPEVSPKNLIMISNIKVAHYKKLPAKLTFLKAGKMHLSFREILNRSWLVCAFWFQVFAIEIDKRNGTWASGQNLPIPVDLSLEVEFEVMNRFIFRISFKSK